MTNKIKINSAFKRKPILHNSCYETLFEQSCKPSYRCDENTKITTQGNSYKDTELVPSTKNIKTVATVKKS